MNDAPTDLDLLALWRSGDKSAGGQLVRRYFPALQRFFATKADGHDEDLIQQTFMACVDAKEAYRGESTFRAYLFGVARMTLLSHYRRVYRRRELQAGSTSIRDLATTPSGVLVRREQERLLHLALQCIPIDQQIALELCFWQDLAAPEIAHALGIPENTVYSRIRRAKAHLRENLARLSESKTEREKAMKLLDRADEE